MTPPSPLVDWSPNACAWVETDRQALADQFERCRSAQRDDSVVVQWLDRAQGFAVAHAMSLAMGVVLISLCAALFW